MKSKHSQYFDDLGKKKMSQESDRPPGNINVSTPTTLQEAHDLLEAVREMSRARGETKQLVDGSISRVQEYMKAQEAAHVPPTATNVARAPPPQEGPDQGISRQELKQLFDEQSAAITARLQEHKATVMTEIAKKPSWASVAAAPQASNPTRAYSATPVPQIPEMPPSVEQPFYITLHVTKLPNDHHLRQQADLQQALALAVRAVHSPRAGNPRVVQLSQHKSGDFRVHLSGYPENVRQILGNPQAWLPKVDSRLRISVPHKSHSIVLHNVAYDLVDAPDILHCHVEEALRHHRLPGGVAHSQTLSKQQRRLNQRSTSMILTLTSGKAARFLCEGRTLSLPYRPATVEPWSPPERVRQCQQCAKFGHKSEQCTASPVCLRCAGPHPVGRCVDKCNSRDASGTPRYNTSRRGKPTQISLRPK